jgi:2-polyprenyl-3-methyl-5-hydroxy-6-metoxy-1,4-benzoquinol methylase
MTTTFEHEEGTVHVEEVSGGRHVISVVPKRGIYVVTSKWETSYPLDLIEHVFNLKGAAYLCDEIRRDEDPKYVQDMLCWTMLSYIPEEAFDGKRILDFGSGCGSSTMVLARMFPSASEIVGAELLPEFVELAQHRARFYDVTGRVSFRTSPGPKALPADIGEFDCVVMSAVWEHLLPVERRGVLPALWRQLRTEGILFLNQTPFRWAPFESHTTRLPLLNYLPDRAACFCANRFSRRIGPKRETWDTLLRMGIRGGTWREINGLLERDGRSTVSSSAKGTTASCSRHHARA